MSDLTAGRYPANYLPSAMYGMQKNVIQSDVPVFCNAPPLAALSDTAAALKTEEGTAVPIAIPYGVEITNVSYRIGSVPIKGVSHSWVALYTGVSGATGTAEVPKLIRQSKDATGQVGEVTTTVTIALEKPVLITPSNAPYGWLYVSIMQVCSEEVSSLATFANAATALTKVPSAAKTYPWLTNAPISAQFHGSSLAATAPETITGGTLAAQSPVVWLS